MEENDFVFSILLKQDEKLLTKSNNLCQLYISLLS